MSESKSYKPPKVWRASTNVGGKFASINRPISGPTYEKKLPRGEHPLQLYSLGTPNGVKVTVMLEELLQRNHCNAEYDAWLIKINEGEQFSTGFVALNPNSKIPAMFDYSTNKPTRIFESGAILIYLAEKFRELLPNEFPNRSECLSWLFWQMGTAPILGGGFGHFFSYAPEKFEYPINRYTMEVKRQLDVLNKHLACNTYLCGNEYTIADIAVWAWHGQLSLGRLYNSAEFLDIGTYGNVIRWAKTIHQRPAVKRGMIVNKTFGNPNKQLHERHSSSDFEGKIDDPNL